MFFFLSEICTITPEFILKEAGIQVVNGDVGTISGTNQTVKVNDRIESGVVVQGFCFEM